MGRVRRGRNSGDLDATRRLCLLDQAAYHVPYHACPCNEIGTRLQKLGKTRHIIGPAYIRCGSAESVAMKPPRHSTAFLEGLADTKCAPGYKSHPHLIPLEEKLAIDNPVVLHERTLLLFREGKEYVAAS